MDREFDLGRTAVLLGALVVLVSLVLIPVAAAERTGTTTSEQIVTSASPSQPASNPCVGTVTEPPNGTTLLSIQGARGSEKTAAMLVGIRPNGSVVGIHNGSANGRWWLYDVDRLSNGNLLLSTTEPGLSIVEEINATSGEHVSKRRFSDIYDSHDADLINGDEILLNDMSQNGDDRVVVYNLTREEITWEYRFEDHPEVFPQGGGGEFGGDWTHNNDVEQIRPGVFMVSVRNFDQVVAIDRETKEIRWKLGKDDDRDILFEQHNPDYIQGENGTPTVLVADSRNDRVVEYAREDGEWIRTWVLRGGGLSEPRDADRLPNGNTLVVDRRGDRLLEVTPSGQVVWEFYAPWQPYDAERIGTGDESTGPTAREMGSTGIQELTGSAGVDERRTEACYTYLTTWSGGRQLVSGDETGTIQPHNTTVSGPSERSTGESAIGPSPSRLPASPVIAGGIVAVLAAVILLGVARRQMRRR